MAILVSFALMIIGLAASPPVHAAVTGQITGVTMSATTLSNGQSGDVCFGFTFPTGSGAGDTVTLQAPADFTLSAPSAYPGGQPIYGPGDVVLAMVTVTSTGVTITRVPAAAEWGEIESTVAPCVSFRYAGGIQADESENMTWVADNSSFDIEIQGAPIVPATYAPQKWGSFFFTSTGEPRIRWTYHSPVGPEPAGTVQFRDEIGPGQEIACSTVEGTIRWWDQSYPQGQDSFTGSWVSWVNPTFTCDPDSGFSGVLAPEIPAPQPGGNPSSGGGPGTERVAYMNLSYETVVTDFSLANTTGWSNSAVFAGVRTASDTRNATLAFPANATGNRGIAVTKSVSGYTDDLDPDENYALQVSCVNSAGDPVAVSPSGEVLVKAGASSTVYAAIGSTCSVAEQDPGSAVAVPSPDVTLTHLLSDTFALSVTNSFATPIRELTVSKLVTGNAVAAEGKTFVLSVDCAVGDASVEGFPLDVSLAAGEDTVLQAPAGSECSVIEEDTQGAVATPSSDVVITTSPSDSFALSVTNNFASPQGPEPTGTEPTGKSLTQSLASTGSGDRWPQIAAVAGILTLCAAAVMLTRTVNRRTRAKV